MFFALDSDARVPTPEEEAAYVLQPLTHRPVLTLYVRPDPSALPGSCWKFDLQDLRKDTHLQRTREQITVGDLVAVYVFPQQPSPSLALVVDDYGPAFGIGALEVQLLTKPLPDRQYASSVLVFAANCTKVQPGQDLPQEEEWTTGYQNIPPPSLYARRTTKSLMDHCVTLGWNALPLGTASISLPLWPWNLDTNPCAPRSDWIERDPSWWVSRHRSTPRTGDIVELLAQVDLDDGEQAYWRNDDEYGEVLENEHLEGWPFAELAIVLNPMNDNELGISFVHRLSAYGEEKGPPEHTFGNWEMFWPVRLMTTGDPEHHRVTYPLARLTNSANEYHERPEEPEEN